MSALTLLAVEDDRRIREQIRAALARPEWQVHLAATAQEALDRLEQLAPDVLVLDLGLPDLDGVELMRRALARRPGTPALVLTIDSSEARILGALRAGARGYLLKEELVRRLATSVEEIVEGGVPLSGPVAQLLLAQVQRGAAQAPDPGPLTVRELEVLEHLASSLTYEQVGVVLGVSINTVRTYVRLIYEKLEVSTRTEAILAGLERGLLTR